MDWYRAMLNDVSGGYKGTSTEHLLVHGQQGFVYEQSSWSLDSQVSARAR